MTQARTLNVLLDELLQLPARERVAWVEALGAEYAALKPRLRALAERSCAEETAAAGFATLPKLADTGVQTPAPHVAPQLAGAKIGPYLLEERLGVGGMAVVWLARDTTPGRTRRVALKFAHVLPSRSDLRARLERERDLLSGLDHPNIARLYDAGMTRDGRSYLVLEYIDGVPIDVFCERNRFGTARRMALFVQVVDAVAHAHGRRIVHRDLKPSNVLVTAEGEARLLDFGVAKLLGGDDGPADLQLSALSGRPLTPAYASPEQITGADVGFASDIYSLGVMLYELLTGERPYTFQKDSSRGLRAAILESVPRPPSEVARDPERQVLLRGGLDALVLTALRKDPVERFGSMEQFAEAVEAEARRLSRLSSSLPPSP